MKSIRRGGKNQSRAKRRIANHSVHRSGARGTDPLLDPLRGEAGQREALRRAMFAEAGLDAAERRRRWIKSRHEIFLLRRKYPEVDFDGPERDRLEAQKHGMYLRRATNDGNI